MVSSNMIPIEINENIAMDVEQISNGGFYPLRTFLNFKNLDSVLKKMRLHSGEVWSIPIIFPKPYKLDLETGSTLLLKFNGKSLAKLEVSEIFEYNMEKLTNYFFGTNDLTHPGVYELKKLPNSFITGKLSQITKLSKILGIKALTPKETRKIIKGKKWKKVVGFHTRNPPHRAHEYLQKSVLQNSDGVLIHPVIGLKKKGDFSNEAIMKSYSYYVQKFMPKEKVILTPLLTYSRYAGPREALFTAIIRRNYGCTHFIVGRDHTGVKNFYGKYDSQKIFSNFPDVGITPICFSEPYFCKKCNDITTSEHCSHGKKYYVEVSGTIIRKAIIKKSELSEIYIRKEILKVLQNMNDVFIN